MATFEAAGLGDQLITNVYGLVKDMRSNADLYKHYLANQARTEAQIAASMAADADAYLARIQWVTDAITRNLSGVTSALAVFGIDMTYAESLLDSLAAVANHTKSAALTTGAEITAEADYILATVPAYDRIY